MSARPTCWIAATALLCSAALKPPVQKEGSTAEPDDIVVNGRIPHCKLRSGDPMDAMDVRQTGFVRKQMVLYPETGTGILRFEKDRDPITGPEVWQRAGSGLDQYNFRVPVDGSPLCIGARSGAPIGHAQLRRELDALAFYGRRVRFTAWIATRHVSNLRLWLATGDNGGVMIGEDNRGKPLEGDHRWTPVSFTLGPIPRCATKVSYGLILQGPGDVWMYRPEFEPITEKTKTALKSTDPHCRAAEKARAAQ